MTEDIFFVDDDKVGVPIPGGYLFLDASRFGHAIIPGSRYGEWEDVLAAAVDAAEKKGSPYVGDFGQFFPEWVFVPAPGTPFRFPSYEFSW